MTRKWILLSTLIMFVAGHETTRGALSGGMKALLDHPAQLAKWQADPALNKSAVEEILRYVTPVNTMARTVAQDIEIGGRQLSEGDRLVLFYASANRDDAVFEAPNEFRIDRSHPVGDVLRQVLYCEIQAFGAGAMVPVGMALVGDLSPRGQRAKPLGFIAAVDTAGWVVGHQGIRIF